MVTNSTIETLLGRRSIRKFKDEAIDDDTRATLEAAAQHAASSQFLNDWSAIRITDPSIKSTLAQIGNQPYIATAPLLYVFVLDEHRNANIAKRKGIDPASSEFHLKYSYRFTQGQNDAVLALHAMETAAESLGLGCVILGSLLNDIPQLIDLLNLPEYTYPVLGLAIGKSPIRLLPSSRVCRAQCSSSRTPIPPMPKPFSTSCPLSTSRSTSITICVRPTVRWMRSAIRSPRSAARMSTARRC